MKKYLIFILLFACILVASCKYVDEPVETDNVPNVQMIEKREDANRHKTQKRDLLNEIPNELDDLTQDFLKKKLNTPLRDVNIDVNRPMDRFDDSLKTDLNFENEIAIDTKKLGLHEMTTAVSVNSSTVQIGVVNITTPVYVTSTPTISAITSTTETTQIHNETEAVSTTTSAPTTTPISGDEKSAGGSEEVSEDNSEEKKSPHEEKETSTDKGFSKTQLNQIFKYLKKKDKENYNEAKLHNLHDRFLLDDDHEHHLASDDAEDALIHILPYMPATHPRRISDLYDHYYNSYLNRNGRYHRNIDRNLLALLDGNPLLKMMLGRNQRDYNSASEFDDPLNPHSLNPSSLFRDHFLHRRDDLEGLHGGFNDFYDYDNYHGHNDFLPLNGQSPFYPRPYGLHQQFYNTNPYNRLNPFHNDQYLPHDNFGLPVYGAVPPLAVQPLMRPGMFPVGPRLGFHPDHLHFPFLKTAIQPSVMTSAFCTNYPDHSTEGFKNFIAMEPCTEPAGINQAGIPVFFNGCTFRYTCATGYQAFQGSLTPLSCNNGYWSGRALCIKDGTSFKIKKRDDLNVLPGSNFGITSVANNNKENSYEKPMTTDGEVTRVRRQSEYHNDEANNDGPRIDENNSESSGMYNNNSEETEKNILETESDSEEPYTNRVATVHNDAFTNRKHRNQIDMGENNQEFKRTNKLVMENRSATETLKHVDNQKEDNIERKNYFNEVLQTSTESNYENEGNPFNRPVIYDQTTTASTITTLPATTSTTTTKKMNAIKVENNKTDRSKITKPFHATTKTTSQPLTFIRKYTTDRETQMNANEYLIDNNDYDKTIDESFRELLRSRKK